MTEPRPDSAAARPDPGGAVRGRRPARSQRPAAVAYGGTAVAFVAVLAGLSWQVATGADPAIGEGQPAVAAAPAKRVLVRRIVRRVVVIDEAPAAVAAAPAPAPAPAAPPAPAASAPAPSAPPASAPAAPAPATTRSS